MKKYVNIYKNYSLISELFPPWRVAVECETFENIFFGNKQTKKQKFVNT